MRCAADHADGYAMGFVEVARERREASLALLTGRHARTVQEVLTGRKVSEGAGRELMRLRLEAWRRTHVWRRSDVGLG